MDPENPPVEEKQADKPHKKERKPKEENKRPRRERPHFEKNAELITIDTVLEPLPKKNEVLPQPKREEYEEKAKKCRERITKLIEKKVSHPLCRNKSELKNISQPKLKRKVKVESMTTLEKKSMNSRSLKKGLRKLEPSVMF